jgi:23S rRNA (adenine2503-C2)-methyltransferase
MSRADLRSMSKEELTAYIKGLGEPAYRAAQLYRQVQKNGADDFATMSDLPAALRDQLAEQATVALPKIISRQESAAGDTLKLLLELSDNERVEMVLMFYERWQAHNRVTCCVSSQSGCAMNCVFCASALHQQFRNLTAGEIVAQVQIADKLAYEMGFSGVTNIVYMGMGEPLNNLAAVKKSIELLNSEAGMNIGMRRITISTCGLVPQIREMSRWGYQVGLAVSLHAADDELRRRLMPGASNYPLSELMAACREYRETSGRRLTVEYALFAGINDTAEDARKLAALLTGTDILVNIIPANPLPEAHIEPPAISVVEVFCQRLTELGVAVQLRRRRGADIEAACGQLRKRTAEGEPEICD